MTNNRKPALSKHDIGTVFERIEKQEAEVQANVASGGVGIMAPIELDLEPRRKGWTPAPTKPAYSQTNVSLEYKGRDYDAILRAAKRKPVGYWEDAPCGIKFGGQPLPSASTNPHGKDVDTPWPKCLMHHEGGYEFLDVYALDAGGLQYHKNDPHAYRCGEPYSTRNGKETVEAVSQAEAAQWLEQNGHKDAAAQLRGKAICPQKPAQ